MVNHMLETPDTVCFTGGTLIDGTGRDPIPDSTVILKRGRVQNVGSSKQIAIPRGSTVIDATNKTIMPGLIDCHVHLIYNRYRTLEEIDKPSLEEAMIHAIKNAEEIVDSGFTTVRDCGTRGSIAVAVRDGINMGSLRGPRILASGPVLTTTAGLTDSHPEWMPCTLSLGRVVDGPWEMVKAVRQQIKLGVNNIKIGGSAAEISPYASSRMPTIMEEELGTAVMVAHDYERRVAFHCQALKTAKIALKVGVDTIEHGTRLDEEAISLFKHSKTNLIPTLCTLYSVLELADSLNLMAKQVEEMRDHEATWVKSFRLAHESGVKIALGSDAGNRYPQGGGARELEFMVRHGMSTMEALEAGTRKAAEAIGMEEEVGTLEAGKRGDLLILDGNPIVDINLLQDRSNLWLIVKGGQAIGGRGLPRSIIQWPTSRVAQN
ncbi:amidohydrolase family protein [SAR202 cluster bacterium AD-804-J14_MRT_500m]|nr:amidohydrolase family protein [SAR202 cluster bacterium AD-804-J14_MRT_500m]